MPCELIEKNGETLKKYIIEYAGNWGFGNEFIKWICEENIFCNTLVDRIVTGYPKDEKIDLGYEDKMLDTSELFFLWGVFRFFTVGAFCFSLSYRRLSVLRGAGILSAGRKRMPEISARSCIP